MNSNDNTLLRTDRFTVQRLSRIHPNGHTTIRAIVRHPGSVVILPIVGRNKICLIRNFRVSVEQTLIELPAGTLELDEAPIDAASRELVEETGYRAGTVTPLHSIYAAPGISDERMHIFVASDLRDGTPAREANEEIENLVVTWDEAMEMIHRKEIVDGKTIAGLLLARPLFGSS